MLTLLLVAGLWCGAPCAAEGRMALFSSTSSMHITTFFPTTFPRGEALKSPQNVEVSIIDDNMTLRWERSDEYDRDVTFSASYQIPLNGINWTELPACQHISAFECSFSVEVLDDVFCEIQLRIRAEKGNDTSPWYEVDSFVPFLKAQIGPPEVHLEAEDKAVLIYISQPGTEDSTMWATDHFKYNIVIWSGSRMEQSIEDAYPNSKIYKLAPKTTYCLKVRATLPSTRKVGFYSPVHCINTTVENKVPPPEKIRVDALNRNYVLKWDYPYSGGAVTFRAQRLPAYIKMRQGDYAEKWKQIQECENVSATHCVIPQHVFVKGNHFIRVQASQGNVTSFWSEEKKFNTDMQTVILPPVINMKPINDSSLRVYIGYPEDSENTPVDQDYPLIYEIIFWENSSNAERSYLRKTDFTIDKLKARTVYCGKVRALLKEENWNKSSVFSATQCQETKPENTSKNMLIVGICIALFLILSVTFLVKALWKSIHYVFFPSSKPPSTINEDFSEQQLNNLLFLTSEEETERCFIIENLSSVTILDVVPQEEGNHKQYSSQSSEDSGNYSNEDENHEKKANEPERENERCDQE